VLLQTAPTAALTAHAPFASSDFGMIPQQIMEHAKDAQPTAALA